MPHFNLLLVILMATFVWRKAHGLAAPAVPRGHHNHNGRGLSRAELFRAALLAVPVLVASPLAVHAADPDKTLYMTGKSPKVPGTKPKDKSDTAGTRRDPSFLRSISDCKSQCETKTASDGTIRTKEDCLSDCQDICCTTYEQCTFGIVPRI
jgi:hypothetical protein